MMLSELLKDSSYALSQFTSGHIQALEQRIMMKEVKGKSSPYVTCLVRDKAIRLTPEEIVRQLYIMVLTDHFDYPVSRLALEYSVSFGREKKRADICIFDKHDTTTPYILVEVKKA